MECHLCILPFQVHSHRADHGHRHPFLYCPQPGDKANRAAQDAVRRYHQLPGQGADSGNRSVVPRPGADALCTSQHERRGDRLYHPGCRPRGRCGHWLPPNGAGRPEALFRYHQRRAEHWREADLPRSGCGPQAVPGGVWRQGYEPKPEGPHLHRYT